MRESEKKIKLFFLLILVASMLTFSFLQIDDKEDSNKAESSRSETISNIELSAPHSSIFIYNDNWSGLGISGDGSYDTPWVIEDYEIDDGGVNNCISIVNSNDYFRIENCTLYNSNSGFNYAGLKLIQSENGLIYNNTFTSNGGHGISFNDQCRNITIQNNTVKDNLQHGIILNTDCSNISIIDNTIYNSSGPSKSGIYVYNNYHNITIRGNKCRNNTYAGITLDCNTAINYDVTIVANELYYNDFYGSFMFTSAGGRTIDLNCSGNDIYGNLAGGMFLRFLDNSLISNNHVHDNPSFSSGIELIYDADNNNFTNNVVERNTNYGFAIQDDTCESNYIYNNTFKLNQIHANDETNFNVNFWNNSVIGNYWDNYTGDDADDDGIGDIDYSFIFGKAGTVDEMPIWDDGFSGTNLIIDELQANNWTWAKIKPWCSGSGTEANPFVISPSNIDPGGIGSGITINNSRAYFKIEGSNIRESEEGSSPNYHAGIKLQNTSNGLIINNNLTANSGSGIYMFDNCDNNSLINNTIEGNRFGIYIFYGCDYNKIIDNYVNGSTSVGIYVVASASYLVPCNYTYIYGNNVSNNNMGIEYNMWGVHCFNLTVENNIVFGHTMDGIKIRQSNTAFNNYNITVKNNHIYKSTLIGLRLGSVINSTIIYNNVSKNDLVGTTHGIFFEHSTDNTIAHNIIANNADRGIYLFNNLRNENNTFYNNSLIDNGINAECARVQNNWDNGIMGNYYSDYAGKDNDDDGVGDSNHTIAGVGGCNDTLPIWWDAPVFNVTTPENTTVGIESAPSFNLNLYEGIDHTVWYTINNSGVNVTAPGLTGTIDQTQWDNASAGAVIIRFFINDSRGYFTFRDISIVKTVSSGGDDDDDDDDSKGSTAADYTLFIIVGIAVGVVASVGLVVKKKKPSGISREEPQKLKIAAQKGKPSKGKAAVEPKKLKKSEEADVSQHIITPQELEELSKTESEIDIEEKEIICVVHKGAIVENIYLCPNCKTFYCEKCAKTLKMKGEHCWACESEIKVKITEEDIKSQQPIHQPPPSEVVPEPVVEPTPELEPALTPSTPPDVREAIKKFEDYISQLNNMVQKLEMKFQAGAVSQEDYVKNRTVLAEKLGEATAHLEQLKE